MRLSIITSISMKTLALFLVLALAIAACSDDTATPEAQQPSAAQSQSTAPSPVTPSPASSSPATSSPATPSPATSSPATPSPASSSPAAPSPAAPPTPAAAVQPQAQPIAIVTTTNIVADWAEIVGGDRANVLSLLPAGVDPHSYQPSARDVAAIADADLVFANGLGLEESWLHELLENAARDESSIVEVTDVIDPIEFGETHIEEVELLEDISHVVHEVEDGEISAEEGLMEIEEVIEAAEARDEDEDHHHEEEHEHDEDEGEHDEEEHEHDEDEEEHEEEHEHDEDEEEHDEEHEHDEDEEEHEDHEHEGEMHLPDMVMELIAQVEDGKIDADEAIEEIEHLTAEGEDEHEGHGHGIHDPHFWFDPLRVKFVINDIAARLSVLDPDGRDTYAANAAAFNAQLDELHAWTQEQVAAVPAERRLLVTSHDSFGYFAVLYGFEIVGTILPGTTEVEPSPADLAELSHEIEEYGVPAIFGETTVSERLATAVASETGAELVRLYSGSLGSEGSGAETYIGMVRTNVQRIVDALK